MDNLIQSINNFTKCFTGMIDVGNGENAILGRKLLRTFIVREAIK